MHLRKRDVVDAGLTLLDEVGIDDFTTRRLAQSLGIESPTLYWHFKDKRGLLCEMATEAMREYERASAPRASEDWLGWIERDARRFRDALSAHRDGARLHVASMPIPLDVASLLPKMHYLARCGGLSEREAGLALFATSRFTLGSVLERQAGGDEPDGAFDFGLALVLDGLRMRARSGPTSRLTSLR